MSDVEKIVNEWVSDRQATHNLSCEMVYGPKTPLFFTVDGSYPGPFLTGPPITIYKVHVDCPHSIPLQIHFSLPAKSRHLYLSRFGVQRETKMELSLSGNAIKTFARCITCLARVENELAIQASPTQVYYNYIY